VLTIRLARIGKKKKPFYRVVVIERTRARDGRVREAVGTYDPLKSPLRSSWIPSVSSTGWARGPSPAIRAEFIKHQKIASKPGQVIVLFASSDGIGEGSLAFA